VSYDESLHQVTAWGHGVTPGHKPQFANFKFLLVPTGPNANEAKWDLAVATGAILPDGKSAEAVSVDYLKEIRMYVQRILESTYGERFLAQQDLLYVFTVPAGWSDGAKALMLDVAQEAGFRGSATLVSESEAAAIYSAMMSEQGELPIGSKFLGTHLPCFIRGLTWSL
jgi:hypothetical protein